MGITQAQRAAAEKQQWSAAKAIASQVRVVAGPGTGKSRTIEKRVCQVLESGASPARVFVISFTRATCAELRTRINSFCASHPHAKGAEQVAVSTMHSLALRILKRANLLNQYPAEPFILDNWEQKRVYDEELSMALACTPTRAGQIRKAYDTSWQTLDPESVGQAMISPNEVSGFTSFHGTRKNLYCCVLPGEVIHECVRSIQLGALQLSDLPPIEHLVVDEFQDLNACDQEFVKLLSEQGATLFIAGDDDQSIYSFRHADPSGIVSFTSTYPDADSHELTDCFRCAPAILGPALKLIANNPNRLDKNLRSLYASADPPVNGTLHVWSFGSAESESKAVAESCATLIREGMAGREDEILILLAQVTPPAVQLDPLTRELTNLGVPYAAPSGSSLTDDPTLRAVYSLLRLLGDRENKAPDYVAHRDLLCLMAGVGSSTTKALAEDCILKNQNFRELFYGLHPAWLTGRGLAAVARIKAVIAGIASWSLGDPLIKRIDEIGKLLAQHIFTAAGQTAEPLTDWLAFAGTLPADMTLDELCQFLGAPSGTDQSYVMDQVYKRLNVEIPGGSGHKKVRILTMHGAKGLTGRVVFIPSASQGIIPNYRALSATGRLIEQRRLFYVSVTRAMAACIISHATLYKGAAAQSLVQGSSVRLTRSQFLNEMGVVSVNRSAGLTAREAQDILKDITNL
jgi:DNA helicase-2/ATP-dependent DNA helicase PcrA